MQTMTLNDFLVWLTAGGAGIVLAFVLERIPAFQALTSAAKSWLTLALTVVIALDTVRRCYVLLLNGRPAAEMPEREPA